MVEEEAERHIEKAYQAMVDSNPVFSFEGTGPKRLVIMSGLPLSGKTFFVNRMNRLMPGQFQQVNTHTIRRLVVKNLGKDAATYDALEHEVTFGVAHRLIRKVLDNGWPVVADATNLNERYRAWAVDAGAKSGAETYMVFMKVTDDAAKRRFEERTSDSSATFDTYLSLKADLEPLENCSVPYLVVDSEADIAPPVSQVARWLSGQSSAME